MNHELHACCCIRYKNDYVTNGHISTWNKIHLPLPYFNSRFSCGSERGKFRAPKHTGMKFIDASGKKPVHVPSSTLV